MTQAYAREIDEHKKIMLLVNKADLLPTDVRLANPPVAYYFASNLFCLLIPFDISVGRNGQNISALTTFCLFSGQP